MIFQEQFYQNKKRNTHFKFRIFRFGGTGGILILLVWDIQILVYKKGQ